MDVVIVKAAKEEVRWRGRLVRRTGWTVGSKTAPDFDAGDSSS